MDKIEGPSTTWAPTTHPFMFENKTPLPPILPNFSFKDESNNLNLDNPLIQDKSSLDSGGSYTQNPMLDQNYLGIKTKYSILKQNIQELDRALLSLQPEVE